jgi:hypothetical protein
LSTFVAKDKKFSAFYWTNGAATYKMQTENRRIWRRKRKKTLEPQLKDKNDRPRQF